MRALEILFEETGGVGGVLVWEKRLEGEVY